MFPHDENGGIEIDEQLENLVVSSNVLQDSATLRFDASYYNSAYSRVLILLKQSDMTIASLGSVTTSVFMPPRFARVYVSAGRYGVPFLQGSHIIQFRPDDVKFLSKSAYNDKRFSEFIVSAGWILVTRSGTAGRAMICPREWDGWAASEHIFRIIPDESKCPSGYLYAFLSSKLGHVQLTSQIYGAVVDELTEEQVRNVQVPVPKDAAQLDLVLEIDRKVKMAMKMRSEALSMINESIDGVSEFGVLPKRDL